MIGALRRFRIDGDKVLVILLEEELLQLLNKGLAPSSVGLLKMFYSHEILTSREGGVATVWLVATLGSNSNLKKVNRKAILEVNIRKTCDIIISPEAPMALRLQSNLLYGVSRVYSQQCGYVLTDAQTAQSNIRQLLKSLRTSELDPEAGKARPEQLVIQDDPAFLPELGLPGLDIDLSALDISTDGSSRRSSLLSPHSLHSSISSFHESDESMVGLDLPSSATGGSGGLGGFMLPGDDRSSTYRTSRLRSILDEEEGFDLDPGFTFDEQGEMVFHDGRAPPPAQPESATRPGPVRLGSDSGISARVRQEIEEGMQAGQFDPGDQMNLDIDLPRFDDDQGILPEAEAFPTTAAQPPAPAGVLRSSSEAPQESSESAEAPAARRRPHAPKYLPMDQQTSLRNNDLASWNNNYAANMADATHAKQQHKVPALAKKNAAFFVYGTGIGGVGQGLGGSKLPSPLDMFAGDQLMTALTGLEPAPTRRKRSYVEEEAQESDSEGRRVRARDDDGDQVGRGEDMAPGDEDTMGMGMDMPGEEDIEIGRHAVPPLADDVSSQMPWNTTASALGSRAGSLARGQAPHPLGFPSSIGGFPSSAGQPGPAPGSIDRRSRLTSASPLVGRGRSRVSSIDLPIAEGEAESLDEFQLYGPAANVSTQTAAESQWMRATLDVESNNFLEFVKSEIESRRGGDEDELAAEEGTATREIQFEELLPPQRHTKVVAAQGLLHVLALATKGLVDVSQREEYGPITLGLRGTV